jgi:ParB family chromosome partitioning protein
LEPVIVRKAAEGYELVAGERRTRAAIKVGLSEIPAIVVDIDDREALEVSIMENLQREDLNAVEETDAVLSLLELSLDASRGDAVALLQEMYNEERGRAPEGVFSGRQKHVASALFRRLGRFTPSSFVANRIPILSFPPELLEVVRQGKLAFTKAQAIARLEEEAARRLLLEAALEEGLSLSQIRRRITQLRRGAPTLERGPAGPTIELAGTTKRLLNRRKLASLDAAALSRVSDLLRELRAVLEG